MAVGPDIELFPKSIEEEVRQKAVQHLGEVAAVRVFEKVASKNTLSEKALLLANLAELIERHFENEPDTAQLIDVAKIEDAEVLSISDRIPHELENSKEPIPTAETSGEAPEQEVQKTELSRTTILMLEKMADQDGITEELGLTADDRDVVIGTIMKANEPFGPKMDIDELRVMLERRYDGSDNMVIAEEFGTTASAVSQRISKLDGRMKRRNVDFAGLLREHVARARNGETISDTSNEIDEQQGIRETTGESQAGPELATDVTSPEVDLQDKPLSPRVQKIIGDLAGEEAQALATVSNKQALHDTLFDLYFYDTKEKKSLTDQFQLRFAAYIEGLTNPEIAELHHREGTPGTVKSLGVWFSVVKREIKKKHTPEQALALLKARVSGEHFHITKILGTQNTEAEDKQSDDVSDEDLLSAALALQRLQEGEGNEDPEKSSNSETAEETPTPEATPEQEVAINDRITQLADKFTSDSLMELFYGDKFDSEMESGREWLRQLIAKYIPDTERARELVGSERFNKEVYKVLQQLSFLNGRQQGDRDRTLPMLLKYNRAVTEEDIIIYLDELLQKAEADPNFALDAVSVNATPINMFRRQQRAAEPTVEVVPQPEMEQDNTSYLWQVAQGKAEFSLDRWETAVSEMFENAVRGKVLTRTEAVSLKPRMLGDDRERTVDQDLRSALNRLQQLATHPEVNLAQDPETAKIVKLFIFAHTLDGIEERLSRDQQTKISKRKARNKLVGGVAYVLDGGNK